MTKIVRESTSPRFNEPPRGCALPKVPSVLAVAALSIAPWNATFNDRAVLPARGGVPVFRGATTTIYSSSPGETSARILNPVCMALAAAVKLPLAVVKAEAAAEASKPRPWC